MFQQIITELKLIKAEEDRAESEEEDDDDEDDENDDMNNELAKFGRYSVPANGYDEDEDCINAEDEEYLQYIRDNKVSQTLYILLTFLLH